MAMTTTPQVEPTKESRSKTCFTFRPKVDEMLTQICKETGYRKTEVVEDALRIYAVLHQELSQGRILVTAEEDGADPHRLVLI